MSDSSVKEKTERCMSNSNMGTTGKDRKDRKDRGGAYLNICPERRLVRQAMEAHAPPSCRGTGHEDVPEYPIYLEGSAIQRWNALPRLQLRMLDKAKVAWIAREAARMRISCTLIVARQVSSSVASKIGLSQKPNYPGQYSGF